jgi:hypothetical protein
VYTWVLVTAYIVHTQPALATGESERRLWFIFVCGIYWNKPNSKLLEYLMIHGAHPASCTMGTGSFPGVESGRGVTLTPHPF